MLATYPLLAFNEYFAKMDHRKVEQRRFFMKNILEELYNDAIYLNKLILTEKRGPIPKIKGFGFAS